MGAELVFRTRFSSNFRGGKRIPSREEGNSSLNATEQIPRLKCPFAIHDNSYNAGRGTKGTARSSPCYLGSILTLKNIWLPGGKGNRVMGYVSRCTIVMWSTSQGCSKLYVFRLFVEKQTFASTYFHRVSFSWTVLTVETWKQYDLMLFN